MTLKKLMNADLKLARIVICEIHSFCVHLRSIYHLI